MTRIQYLGHAGFQIETASLRLIFDPWIRGNPLAEPKTIEPLTGADYVFVSHDHGDHGFEEAVAMCLADQHTTFVGINEIGNVASDRGVKKVVRGNLGGSTMVGEGVEVFFTIAYHSCDVGTPCGFVVKTPELTLYHAGDTALYSDMKLLSDRYDMDLALLPIGSTFTMGPQDAARAVALLDPKIAIPMHYNTFDVIRQDPGEFRSHVGDRARVEVLQPGAVLEL